VSKNRIDVVDRFLGFDHRDHQHLVVGDRLIGARFAIGGGADRAVAALALRRIETSARQRFRVGRGVDQRTDHTPGAGIEHLADHAGLVPGHAHQRRDRAFVHRLKALHHRLVVLHAVLHVDGDAVETALRHHLGREA
jgi:hypothetical protein